MDAKNLSKQLGLEYIHPTLLSKYDVLSSINHLKVIKDKEIKGKLSVFHEVSSLIFNIERAIYEASDDHEDFRDIFQLAVSEVKDLLPIGIITVEFQSIKDFELAFAEIDSRPGFNYYNIVLFMLPNEEIWAALEDKVYLLGRSIAELIYNFSTNRGLKHLQCFSALE